MKRPSEKYEKYWYAGLTGFFVAAAALVIKLLFDNLGALSGILSAVNTALMPVYIGLIIAYLLSPLVNKVDKYVFIPLMNKIVKKKEKATGIARGCSVALVFVMALLVIFGLIMLVVPEVVNSITRLISNLPGYYQNIQAWVNDVFKSNPKLANYVLNFSRTAYENLLSWLQDDLLPNSNKLLTMLTDGVVNTVNVLFNIFIGAIISIYLMAGKENFCAQAKRLMFSVFPVKHVNSMLSVLKETHVIFAKFISGKILDSLAVGILTFIVMSIAGIPYTILISVIIGVTNIIPFFGQYIGIIPSAILVFIESPIKGVIFLVLIIVLMQFDGNILGPKILGDSIGLKSFWILFSILFFGSLFGLLGMICAVPLFAIIYRLVKRWSERRLTAKNIPAETAYYRNILELEEQDGEGKQESK